jgi:hypothetical protein
MRYFLFQLVSFFVLVLCACQNSVTRNIAPLVPKSDTSAIEKKNTLFAFVGEKMDVQSLPVDPESMDGGIRAKYEILLPVYGSYSGETIEFIAYDHYGWPAFASFKNVLLFYRNIKASITTKSTNFLMYTGPKMDDGPVPTRLTSIITPTTRTQASNRRSLNLSKQ